MEKGNRRSLCFGAAKLASVFCFWLAFMLIIFPVANPGAQVSADAEIHGAIEAVAVDEQQAVVPESTKLIPLGRTTGIKMFSEGTMVVGFAQLEAAGGKSPAQAAGLEIGDVIVALNDRMVGSNEELVERLAELDSSQVFVTAKRDEQEMQFTLEAVFDSEKQTWRIGAWVRDSIAGIGTITFVDPDNGAFGALGHGISDADTGQLMPFQGGSIMESSVAGVKKGQSGTPGELTGKFNLENNQGQLYSNTSKGIFGQITDRQVYEDGQALEVAPKSATKEGSAYIISNVEGQEVRQYEIEILRVYPDNDESSRDMMIRIVDKDLIDITGGIVQGMSGSPIIQNGKLIGAVTHVLINDPQRGYGISIENMIAEAIGA